MKMGMYTELVLKCEISADSPQSVKAIIKHMFAGGDEPGEIPEHDFFKCDRWKCVGAMSSFYHHPAVVNSVPEFDYTDSFYVFSRSDLKNYDDEISKFVDWVTPYIEGSGDICIGWSWYEEDEKPELIIIKK